MSREEILISNLPANVKEGVVQEEGAPGVWRAVAYRSGSIEGVLLGCGEMTAPKPVIIRLAAEGNYRIRLGVPVLIAGSHQVRVRLSGDLCCTPLTTTATWENVISQGGMIAEVHWKDANLTDQDLILESAFDPNPRRGSLAWIRLEPVESLPAPPKRAVTHPMAMTEDGFGIFARMLPHRRPEDILELYEQIPEGTALRIMLWGAADGDTTTYPSKIGQVGTGVSRDFDRFWDHMAKRNVDLWREKGWDSIKLPRDYCRRRGWEFHTSIRLGAFAHSYPWDESFHSKFFHQHPEWNCYDAQGQRVVRMSYAYPQVQEHMLGIVDELVAYEPDGVMLVFIRGLPLVLYEPIMVQGFKKKHGIDPRGLDEFDPRWMSYQAEVITPFIRAVKGRLKPGMRLSAIVPGNKFDLDRWGLDVAAWVREGLLEDLYPMGQRFTGSDAHIDGPEGIHLEYFHGLPGRENIRLFAALYAWGLYRRDLVAWRQLVYSYLARGADGYCIWDGALIIKDIGDIGLAEPRDITPPKQPTRYHRVHTVGGFRVDRYHSFEVV